MALGSSVGYGIAFQGKPDSGANIAEQNIRTQGERLGREKAKRDAEAEKYKETSLNVDVSGVDPVYKAAANLAASKLIDFANQTQNKGGKYGNWINDPELNKKVVDTKLEIEGYQQATQNLQKDLAEHRNNPLAYTPNKEQFDLYASKPEDYYTYLQQKQNGNPLYKGGLFDPVSKAEKPVYSLDLFQKNVKPVISSSSAEKPSGDYFVTEGGTYFDVAKNRALADQNANKNTLAGATAIGQKIKEFNVDETTAKKMVADEFYDNLKARAGVKNTQSIQEAKTGAGSAADKSKKNLSLVVNQYGGQDNMQFQFKDIKDNVPLDFILQNGEAVKGIPKSFERNKDGTYDLHVAVPVTSQTTNAQGEVVQKIVPGEFVDRKVDYKSGADVIKNEYGFNPYEVLQGNLPKNIEVHKVGEKAKNTDEKVTITKAELAKKAVAAGYTYDDYYEVVKNKIILK